MDSLWFFSHPKSEGYALLIFTDLGCMGLFDSLLRQKTYRKPTKLLKGHRNLGQESRALWGHPESMAKEQGDLHDPFMGHTLETSLAVPMLQGEEPGARKQSANLILLIISKVSSICQDWFRLEMRKYSSLK
ncbi:hypothetical protein HGM15179_008114 [Zosterops borbonicus]|uniref:Uncharacterized protein n=1 Tax=Zosterops borbonicus TaxID=364589 RepID=A0A8K1GJ47_9PASS|nr:hypothetical protein HGM15179_008114 [Zosterops borbonicus]